MVKKGVDKRSALFIFLFVLVIMLRFFLARVLYIRFMPDYVHDDILQFIKGLSFADGDWMGPYSHMALVKRCVFPVFLGLSVKLDLSYILCIQGAFVISSLIFIWAIYPMIKNKALALLLFTFIIFSPISLSGQITRIYRDSLHLSLCMLFFSGIVGLACRYKEKSKWKYLFAFFAGFGLSLADNTREDSQWLFIFIGIGFLVYALFVFTDKELRKKTVSVLMAAVITATGFAAVTVPICVANYRHYGVFATDEYYAGSFADAFGALTRPYSSTPSSYMSVPRDVREKLYKLSPSFAMLESELEGNGAVSAWKGGSEDYITCYFFMHCATRRTPRAFTATHKQLTGFGSLSRMK